jgi:hypothetical protein
MKKRLVLASCLLGAVLSPVVFLVGLHPVWLGPVARTVSEKLVPSLTGTAFRMDALELNAFSGRIRARGVELANPAGYRPARALAVGALDLSVDVSSALSDVIVIREVALRDAFVSYVTLRGTNNFEAIAAYRDRGADPAKAEAAGRAPAPDGKKEAPAKKVIIDRLLLTGLKVQMGPLALPVPDIELKGIGRDTQGADWTSVGQQILDAAMKRLGGLGAGLGQLGGSLKELGMESGGEALKKTEDFTKRAGKALESAGGVLKGAEGALKGLLGD